MKFYLEIINYESDQTNFIVKIKAGQTIFQTTEGNNWKKTFIIENKKNTDIIVEVWQKVNQYRLIGESHIPKIEKIHNLIIEQNGKKMGILNVSYKEVLDSITNQIIKQDYLNLSKIEKQGKAIQKLNDSLSVISSPHYDFTSIAEYFQQNLGKEEIDKISKNEADSIIQNALKNIIGNIQIEKEQQHLDFQEQIQSEQEKQNIDKLQRKLIKVDLIKYEKKRRAINQEIIQLDEMYNKLRIDQQDQKNQIEQIRKELIQKLLFIEDKVDYLQKQFKKQKHHVFGSNANLLNSQIEMSSIEIQNDFIKKWENDPILEQKRKEFIDKQMKEWNHIQDMREKRIKEQENNIKQEKEKIEQQKKLLQEELNKQKKQEIEDNLKKLEEQQKLRKLQLIEANKRFLQKKEEKYLAYRNAEQDAKYRIQLQEERKLKLKQLKNPDFEIQEINLFEQKFLKLQKQKQEKRNKEWNDREAQWEEFQQKYNPYKSANYQQAKQRYRQVDQTLQIEKEERIKKTELFSQEVKVNYFPDISKTKQKEMNSLIKKLKYEPDFHSYKEMSKKIQQKHIYDGIDYQEVLKQKGKMIKLIPLKELPTKISPRDIGDFYLQKYAKKNKKHIAPLTEQPLLDRNAPQSSPHLTKSKPLVVDFLKEQRIKKKNLELQKLSNNNKPVLEGEDQKLLDLINKQLKLLEK